ncbi:isoprenylcysteine carboxylmethyltransferase family protein [candidate division WOR-3 bacterium]|nr:isoprenylcysteine carboxylmethyltransferase family protein [candidate division WOR-3 bacterium]
MSAQAGVLNPEKKSSRIRWGRLIWTVFVVLYLINFTKNLFADVAGARAAIPVIYFILWILWLGIEFYFEAQFYQSSLVPKFNSLLKAGFAVYFYALQGLAPWDWLGGTKINLIYPVFNMLGLLIFALGVAIRIWALVAIRRNKTPKELLASRPWAFSRHPRYIGMFLIMFAVPLVFFSPWAMLATVVIGLPLWYLEVRFEERKLKKEWGQIYENYCKTRPLVPRFKR